MKYISPFFRVFVVGIGLWGLSQPLVQAVRSGNGTVTFAEPPLLVAAKTPYLETSATDTTYYFTLDLPANAGEPLQKVTFLQTEGSQPIKFDLKNNRAFEGTQEHKGSKLTLKPPIQGDRSSQKITVIFDPPVAPGKTVTIALRTIRNPLYDGIYLFGVTAFPAGEQATGQFIGYGRLHFYSDGDSN